MKKIILTTLTLLLITSAMLNAQVTIGSDAEPDANALLDLKNLADGTSDKGMLLPRVKLDSTTSAAPLTAHVAGMVVYNTNTAGKGTAAVTPGYYYNDGVKWVKLIADATLAKTGWSLTGNTGTEPATHFIGTTDNKPLVIRTKNTPKVIVDTLGNMGIGIEATNPTNRLHIKGKAGENPVRIENLQASTSAADKLVVADANGIMRTKEITALSNAWSLTGNTGTDTAINFIGTTDDIDVVFRRNNNKAGFIGKKNTAFGLGALSKNTTGIGNVAIGDTALHYNTIGDNNIAIGNYTLRSAPYGTGTENGTGNASANVAIGTSAMGVVKMNRFFTYGDSCVAIGFGAMRFGGTNSVAIGNKASNMVVGINSIFIGSNTKDPKITTIFPVSPSRNFLNIGNSIYGRNIYTNDVKIGIGRENYDPTNTLHVKGNAGTDPVRFENLQASTSDADKVVVADANGVLRTRETNGTMYGNIRTLGVYGSTTAIASTDYTILAVGDVQLPPATAANKGQIYNVVYSGNADPPPFQSRPIYGRNPHCNPDPEVPCEYPDIIVGYTTDERPRYTSIKVSIVKDGALSGLTLDLSNTIGSRSITVQSSGVEWVVIGGR